MLGVVLAAGRGSRLAPLTDTMPKCMVPLAGKPLLHHQIDAMRAGGVESILVVRGYAPQAVKAEGIKTVDNPRWNQTNMVGSLLCARDRLAETGAIVSYADIFYEARAVASLIAAPADIALTYDVNWRELWSSRFEDPLEDAETFRLRPDSTIMEIGKRPESMSQVEGQYMGLLKITRKGWKTATAFLDGQPTDKVDQLDMTSLISALIATGAPVLGVSYDGRWGEVDTPQDLALYERDFEALT